MKLALLLCALILSLHGWCAVPARSSSPTMEPDHHTIASRQSQEGSVEPVPADKTKTALIGWALITWLTFLIGWAVMAKNSLDKILRDVLQGMAQYS